MGYLFDPVIWKPPNELPQTHNSEPLRTWSVPYTRKALLQ